jgi:hypothetical protein
MRVSAAAVLAVAGFVTLSCGGINDPSKNTVTPGSGTLGVNGSVAHQFTAAKSGEISVKLTALAPTANAIIGLIWVQATNDGACTQNTFQQTFAQLNLPAISGPIVPGRYCIIVYDVGTLTVPQTYTIAISHP